MWGRLLGLAAGLALVGEAFVLWRPEAVGALATPDLGPFTPYRPIIALLAAAVGAALIVAALLREPARPKSRAAGPAGFDWDAGAPEPAAAPPAAIEAARPPPAETRPAPMAEAIVELHEPEALAPFPAGDADAHEPAVASEPMPVQALPAAEARGTFLAAIDAGDQMRAANRLDDALELYDGALSLARRAHAVAGPDPTASRDLTLALTSVADIHDREGRLESALALHEESLGLRRSLAAQAPDDFAAQRALSLGLERLADTREARGHRSRARDLFRERLPLAQQLAAQAPADADLAQDLAATRERLQELDAALQP
jgi:tetratricopeptide (TPR) repeat protein